MVEAVGFAGKCVISAKPVWHIPGYQGWGWELLLGVGGAGGMSLLSPPICPKNTNIPGAWAAASDSEGPKPGVKASKI